MQTNPDNNTQLVAQQRNEYLVDRQKTLSLQTDKMKNNYFVDRQNNEPLVSRQTKQ